MKNRTQHVQLLSAPQKEMPKFIPGNVSWTQAWPWLTNVISKWELSRKYHIATSIPRFRVVLSPRFLNKSWMFSILRVTAYVGWIIFTSTTSNFKSEEISDHFLSCLTLFRLFSSQRISHLIHLMLEFSCSYWNLSMEVFTRLHDDCHLADSESKTSLYNTHLDFKEVKMCKTVNIRIN